MVKFHISLCLLPLSVSATSHIIQHVSLPWSNIRTSPPRIPPETDLTIPITGRVPRREHKKALFRELRSRNGRSSASGSQATSLSGAYYVSEYLINATIGSNSYSMVLDTGSSDTWLARKGFSCSDLDSNPEPESVCAFGSTYNPNESKTFKSIPGVNFNIGYGDGEFLTGTAGNETVTIGGLTVRSQEIGIVTNAAWNGDGISSGLVGLAYPDLTSVYVGTNTSNDDFPNNSVFYSPFPFRAVETGELKNPFFSISLDRGKYADVLNTSGEVPSLGFLAWGGIPPAKAVPVTNISIVAPVQGYSIKTLNPANITGAVDLLYTVDVQQFTFAGSQGKSSKSSFSDNVILDTGTTFTYVPTHVADSFAAAIRPPASWSDEQDGYVVQCHGATIPEFYVTIGGVRLTMDPKDNVVPIGQDDNGRDICLLGVSDGGENTDSDGDDTLYVLGDTFLHNIVTVFNIQDNELTLIQRQKY